MKKRLGLTADESSPLWVSELYQLAALAVGVVFVVLCRYLPDPWRVAVSVLALYRPFEIVLFTTAWVFVRGAEAVSTKRSLVGLLVNVAEVVVGFAAAYLGFGCVQGARAALYSSLRTLVTIGPIGTLELPQSVGALRESRGGPTRS